jgi:hypothetical protein
MRKGCSICNAKSKNNAIYRRKFLCPECANEYKSIFDGWMSKKQLKKRCKEAFKKGWQSVEIENNLSPIPIPPEVLKYYQKLILDEEDD